MWDASRNDGAVNKREEHHFIDGPAGKLEIKTAYASDTPDSHHDMDHTQFKNVIGIVCHPHPLYQGTMDNKVVTTIVKSWRKKGLAAIRFNFRGVGESEGQYGEGKGEIEDLQAVIQWAKQHFVGSAGSTASIHKSETTENHDMNAIWLAGFSFGSFIAASVAAEQNIHNDDFKINRLLTIAPPVHHFGFEALIPSCPWLTIQGDADEVVPFERVQAWFEKLSNVKRDAKLIVMKGASHFFHGRLIELQAHIEAM